jgi:hypothetical protein
MLKDTVAMKVPDMTLLASTVEDARRIYRTLTTA